MIRTFPFAILAFSLLLSSCGWAEWPPPGDGPRVTNRPQTSGGPGTASVDAAAVIVAKGDTVYGLSKRYRVSARAIIQTNHLQAPYMLTPGQRLVLPRALDYAVRRGDSLSVIAESQNADMYAIARLNGLRPPYTIQIGQRLTLPDATRVRPVSMATAKAPVSKRKSLSTKEKTVQNAVDSPPARTGKGFLWPVRGKIVSSYGGKSEGLKNDGINIAAPRGAQVVAAENGIVAYAGNELRGFGNLLLLKHTGGWITAYAHNETVLVKRGDTIKKGQTIARVGSSGSVQVPQLHFELRKGKKAINPIKYLTKVTMTLP